MIVLLTRLILIPLAYIAAIVTAGSVAAGIALVRAYPPVAHDPVAVAATSWVIFEDFVVFCIQTGGPALLPAAVAIVVAEIFALRSVLYFCGAGLVAAYAVSRFVSPAVLMFLPAEPAIAAASALAGGFTYWLLCGRLSGLSPKAEPRHS